MTTDNLTSPIRQSRSQHPRVTLTAAAAVVGIALFLSGYWAGSAGGGSTEPIASESRTVPDWFLPIADAYDRNPKVTPEFDFASLYDTRPLARITQSELRGGSR